MSTDGRLRIVAGTWRGRTIRVAPGPNIRPTRDRIREAWMSIINPYIPGARVVDLFAGSGALGIEALSRGASHAEFIERDPTTATVLKSNLDTLGATPRSKIWRTDALQFAEQLQEHSFDIAVADPPYATTAAVRLAELWLQTRYATHLSIEHDATLAMPPGGDTRRYGTSSITFYR